MPTYKDYDRDYHAEDRDEVLSNIQKYGTDDRSQWGAPTPSYTQPGAPVGTGTFNQPDQTMGQQPSKGIEFAPQSNQGSQLANSWNAPSSEGTIPKAGAPTPPQGGAWDRTSFRDSWMGSGVNTVAGMKAWLAANPQLAQGVQIVGPKQDKFLLPTGEIIDGVLAAGLGGGQGGPQWTGAGGTQNGVPVGGGGYSGSGSVGGAGGGATPGSGAPGTGGVDPNAPGSSDIRSQLMQALLGRMNQSEIPDRNNPVIRAQSDAYNANEERARRNYLGDLAESRGPVANMRGEQRLSAERVGQRTGAFEADLMGRELTARRDQIQQALSQVGSTLSEQERLALQRELGYMNNAIQQAQVANQGRGLDLQGRGLDQQWQSTLLNNEQFNRNLGLQVEDRSAYWDALRSGLING